MKIIDLTQYREQKRIQIESASEKKKALTDLDRVKLSDSMKYNHQFYKLVDLFMQEHYPDYAWKFEVWLDQIGRSDE